MRNQVKKIESNFTVIRFMLQVNAAKEFTTLIYGTAYFCVLHGGDTQKTHKRTWELQFVPHVCLTKRSVHLRSSGGNLCGTGGPP